VNSVAQRATPRPFLAAFHFRIRGATLATLPFIFIAFFQRTRREMFKMFQARGTTADQ